MSAELQVRIAGLDALEQRLAAPAGAGEHARRLWSGLWPKLAAVGIAVALWQVVVWTGWKPTFALPPPLTVIRELGDQIARAEFWEALAVTGRRAVTGFSVATLIGLFLGFAVARFRVLRIAVGSLITGLQTMPSIAWFPFAIMLFGITEHAIFFVVVLGAAPSIANGVLTGVDYVPPLLLRAGRNIGARGINLYRYVIGPAALPSVVAGLKQGWAFSWRSLMAGELLVIIAERPSLGANLHFAREFSDAPWLLATMIVILAFGLVADAAFSWADERIRRRRGLADVAA